MLFRLHGRVAQNLSERVETMSQFNNLHVRTYAASWNVPERTAERVGTYPERTTSSEPGVLASLALAIV